MPANRTKLPATVTAPAFIMLIAASGGGPASAQQSIMSGRQIGPISANPKILMSTILSAEPGAEPAGSLSDIWGTPEIDNIGHLIWSVRRDGAGAVKAGDTFSLAYLSRGKPTYKKVGLLFGDDLAGLNTGRACEVLSGGAERVTSVKGLITVDAEAANAELIARAGEQKSALMGSIPQYLVHVTAAYNDELIAAAAANRKLAVRAFPLGSDDTCLRGSAGAYVMALATWKAAPPIVFPKPKQPDPSVGVSVVPVGWSPYIDKNCSYIVTASVDDPAWKEVMKQRGISQAVGTHFNLCQTEFQMTYDSLSDSTKAMIALKNALGAFSSAFNWTAGAFQSIATTLSKPLVPVLGKNAAKAFTEAMMGQLPGAPLTGDMNMLVDQGCGYVKTKVSATIAEDSGQKQVTNDQKKTSDDLVQKGCDAVKAALQEKARVNDFLQTDLAKEPRNAVMWVRISYSAQYGAAAGTLSKEMATRLTVHSKGGEGPHVKGFGGPETLLYKRDVTIPAGAAGTSMVVPFTMEYAIPFNSETFMYGATAYAGMNLNAGGYYGTDIVIHSIMQEVPPPAA